MPSTETTVENKIQLSAKFLADAPPGEFHEVSQLNPIKQKVLNDLRVLINNDSQLQNGIKSAVRQYNLTQFLTSKLSLDDSGKEVFSF
jgi:hypothetical protein